MLPHVRPLPLPPPASPPASPAVLGADANGVLLRPLASLDDYQACVALQREVWGADFADVVPASLLQVATHIGGVLVGAFADATLVGFVFGLTGVEDDELVHWSHMLGVRAEAREMGIGRTLKEYQRTELARRGVARELWTFDPLQARNAHLNINRLGVRVIDYVVNMYGTTGSPLHFGMPTDRLIAECATANRPRLAPPMPAIALERLPILTLVPQPGDTPPGEDQPHTVMIEIPSDLQIVLDQSPEAVPKWRLATRAHFQWAFSHGYRVTSFHRDRASSRSFYVLIRDSRDGEA